MHIHPCYTVFLARYDANDKISTRAKSFSGLYPALNLVLLL